MIRNEWKTKGTYLFLRLETTLLEVNDRRFHKLFFILQNISLRSVFKWIISLIVFFTIPLCSSHWLPAILLFILLLLYSGETKFLYIFSFYDETPWGTWMTFMVFWGGVSFGFSVVIATAAVPSPLPLAATYFPAPCPIFVELELIFSSFKSFN